MLNAIAMAEAPMDEVFRWFSVCSSHILMILEGIDKLCHPVDIGAKWENTCVILEGTNDILCD